MDLVDLGLHLEMTTVHRQYILSHWFANLPVVCQCMLTRGISDADVIFDDVIFEIASVLKLP